MTNNTNLVATIVLDKSFPAEFKKHVRREISLRINNNLPRIAAAVEFSLRTLIYEKISSSPEYDSVSNSQLKFQLGLPDGAKRIGDILQIWINNISVVPLPAGGSGFLGGLDIGLIQSDYSDVLSSSSAEFVTEKGTTLRWLKWLLTEGSSPIVLGYRFTAASSFGSRSRTGKGLMIKRSASGWSIPPQFAGTESNNFVTRALSDLEDNIDNIVTREFIRFLK